MALGGLALVHVLQRGVRPGAGTAVAALLAGGSLTSYVLGRSTVAGAAAYSGTTSEVLGATLLAASVVVASFVGVDLARRHGAQRVLDPCSRPVASPSRHTPCRSCSSLPWPGPVGPYVTTAG